MKISRTCRRGLIPQSVLWTTVCLILLAGEVRCVSEEQTRVVRSPAFEPDTEAPGGMTPQEVQSVIQFFRTLLQRQHLRGNGAQQDDGDEVNGKDINWRLLPLPVLKQLRALSIEGSKEEDKRHGHLLPCYFKVCNFG